MKSRVAGIAGCLCLALSACNGSPPPTPIEWWNGVNHATLFGRFAIQNSTEGPPTAACDGQPTPVNESPEDWWVSLGPNVTGGVLFTDPQAIDVVGYTVWSNEAPGCSRAMQTVYRSVMEVDISGLYAAAPTPADLSNNIATAELMFNVIERPAINPANWPCNSYTGSLETLSTLRPGATVTQGFTRVGGLAGTTAPADLIAAFPQRALVLADLSRSTGPGTVGRVTASTTGPGSHVFRVDIKDVLRDAISVNRQSLGFMIESFGETAIGLTSDVQFACRTFIQPVQLNVKHW
jgi:hypothetical protein